MVRLKGFKERMSVDLALRLFLEVELKKVDSEYVSVFDACGRIISEDIIAKIDVPHFDRSAVDGYAVRAEDTFGASLTNPVILKLAGEVEIGEKPCELKQGEAVKVSTGSALPKGANAVVMLEYAREFDENVEVYKPVTPWENVSKKGEDVKAGEVVLKKGEVLQPQDIGIISALGYSKVKVLKRVKVAVIATGNELVEVGEKPEVGKVVNSNSPMLCCAIKEFGCEPLYLGIARDDFGELLEKIRKAVEVADIVTITGGTSVGKKDIVPEVVKKLGRLIVHGVAMKPGMPPGLGAIEGKPILLLPSFPVATLISFYTFFPEILARITGIKIVAKKWSVVRAKLKRRIPSQPGVRTFARVLLKEGLAEPIRTSGSGILTSMIRANGMVVVPEDKEGFEEGESVEVILIRDLIKDS